eukprot:350072-Chlamydomonas_euryale.AAC.2
MGLHQCQDPAFQVLSSFAACVFHYRLNPMRAHARQGRRASVVSLSSCVIRCPPHLSCNRCRMASPRYEIGTPPPRTFGRGWGRPIPNPIPFSRSCTAQVNNAKKVGRDKASTPAQYKTKYKSMKGRPSLSSSLPCARLLSSPPALPSPSPNSQGTIPRRARSPAIHTNSWAAIFHRAAGAGTTALPSAAAGEG